MLTQAMVREMFDYREDGNFIRKTQVGTRGAIGTVAGCKQRAGDVNNRYSVVGINGVNLCLHKLIFMWHNGYMPKVLDHINGNSKDNRIENLRVATHSQNMHNQGIRKNNTSGAKGVSYNKTSNKWYTYISLLGKRIGLGYHDDFEFADLVATEARDLYHGQYARHI
jgi:hypothetical protein